VLNTTTINNKRANTSRNEQDKTGKTILATIMLTLMLAAALVTGLWSGQPTTGWGASIVAWPGQVWQQILQGSVGAQTGTGLAQQSPWVLARVAGMMAYLLSFASVTLGLVMSMRWKWVRNILHPSATFYLHKIMALLTVVFLVLHLTGLLLDNYVKISLIQILIPFSTSSYRPLWTGLGTIAIYCTVLVMITAYMASKLGHKVWRTIHYLTFGIFGLSLLHGIMSGTDTSSLWAQMLYVGSGLVVVSLTAMRFGLKQK
jgi:predicted ferric reductase